jgi:hypothetical protein
MKAKARIVVAALGFLAAAYGIAQTPVPSTQAPQINAISLDTSLSCEDARTRFAKGDYSSPEEGQILMMRVSQCDTKKWNQEHPEDPKVIVVSSDKTEGKILFNTLRIKDAEHIRDAAKVVISAAVIANTGAADPLSVAVISGGTSITMLSMY